MDNANVAEAILASFDAHKFNGLSDIFESEATQPDDDKADLNESLLLERGWRQIAEKRCEELEQQVKDLQKKRKRRTKAEIENEEPIEISEYTATGRRKARPASPIRSYSDFVSIQNYFLDRGKIRDWTLWTVGVSLGLRISDLLNLKICSFITEDHKFRERVWLLEKKTSKVNNCLITESVIDAITRYFDSINWEFRYEDYLFQSYKTKGKMREEYGWKIISDAGKALGLPINIGSHTMRKSFANIAACVDKSSIDMNAITKIQGLLNHSDQKVTMRYLGTFQDMYDRARIAVSDFVLGKTDVEELVAGDNHTINDIMAKLDEIDAKMSSK